MLLNLRGGGAAELPDELLLGVIETFIGAAGKQFLIFV